MKPIIPRADVTVRPATPADVPFIDSLQKLHSHQVGWMPMKQLEGKIAGNQVIVAEVARCSLLVASESKNPGLSLATSNEQPATRLGYCIGHDQYFKRDDVGIIYQMNVAPGRQRSLVGAMLLKAQFERSAWGCKLYCCWCAQDTAANQFWEAMGFVALAFRAGSENKARVHIFWQRRIRAGDVTTPYWFPAQTTGGCIREDRLVLPIPPGTHWSDVMPRVLPGVERCETRSDQRSGMARRTLTGSAPPRPDRRPVNSPTGLVGLRFLPPPGPAAEKPKREAKKRRKNDPKLIAAARELRDRWLEQVNAAGGALRGAGKYDVSRRIEGNAGRAAGSAMNASPIAALAA